MPRLISWAPGVRYISQEPLSGPRTVGAGSSEGIGGYVQTVASPFGLWRWRFGFPPLQGEAFRRFRGMLAALHGGANAVRVPIYDPDKMPNANAAGKGNVDGVLFDSFYEDRGSLLLGDGTDGALLIGDGTTDTLMADFTIVEAPTPWFVPNTSTPWDHSTAVVPLLKSLAIGDIYVTLADAEWGHSLIEGDYLGFGPSYFGLHTVTQVMSDGNYKVWPPIRKALTTSDWATLDPVIAMRLESEDAGSSARGQFYSEGLTLTLVEVEDRDVRQYFTDFA